MITELMMSDVNLDVLLLTRILQNQFQVSLCAVTACSHQCLMSECAALMGAIVLPLNLILWSSWVRNIHVKLERPKWMRRTKRTRGNHTVATATRKWYHCYVLAENDHHLHFKSFLIWNVVFIYHCHCLFQTTRSRQGMS